MRPLTAIGILGLAALAGLGIYLAKGARPADSDAVTKERVSVGGAALSSIPTASHQPTASAPTIPKTRIERRTSLREELVSSNDYRSLVDRLMPMALDGNPESEYVIARAMKWCAQTTALYFVNSDQSVRTLDEAQAIRNARPLGISSEHLSLAYQRCSGFLSTPQRLADAKSTWRTWLSKAADGGLPAAVAQKASLDYQAQLISNDSAGIESARDTSLGAAASGDADAIFFASDFAEASGTSREDDTAVIASAWRMVACNRGFDCGPTSDWMIAACVGDPQCVSDRDYIQHLQRVLGHLYSNAEQLATEIDQAILKKDMDTLRNTLTKLD